MQNELQVFAGSLIGLSLRIKGIKLLKKKCTAFTSKPCLAWPLIQAKTRQRHGYNNGKAFSPPKKI